jgi:monoamine oxidase
VIVTLPLGVLQRSPAEGGVAFSPPLSAAKRSAIDSLGMGTENKVALRWDPDDVFWPATQPYLQCSDPRFRFLNAHYFGKLGVLVVMVAPPFALSMEAMDDAGVLGVLLPMLRTTFAPKASELPPPIECHVTRWGTDPYCFGSYSYDKLGSAVAMRHDLRAAERAEGAPTPRLFFAGEACSTDAPQCVHGAVETGRLASDELLRALTLDSCCDEPAVESVLADGAPLQCMCRLLYDPRRETVQCVVCAQVYHTECVGFGQPSVEGEETALSPEDYRCYRCSILPDGLV